MDLATWLNEGKTRISASELARRVGVTPQMIYHIRDRKNSPSLEVANKIVAVSEGEIDHSELEKKPNE